MHIEVTSENCDCLPKLSNAPLISQRLVIINSFQWNSASTFSTSTPTLKPYNSPQHSSHTLSGSLRQTLVDEELEYSFRTRKQLKTRIVLVYTMAHPVRSLKCLHWFCCFQNSFCLPALAHKNWMKKENFQEYQMSFPVLYFSWKPSPYYNSNHFHCCLSISLGAYQA